MHTLSFLLLTIIFILYIKSVLSNIDNKTIGKLLNNEHPDGYYQQIFISTKIKKKPLFYIMKIKTVY